MVKKVAEMLNYLNLIAGFPYSNCLVKEAKIAYKI